MENKPMISETEKREALKQFMAEKAKAPVCVAFSGGVDSSLILKLACDTAKKTGMPVYAVTFHTMLHPACDLEIAERVAKELGAIHKIIQVNEMELEAIRTNPVNRCYICKHHLFATLLDFAKEGEDYLRSVFGGNVRLRLHGDIVRIEVDADKFEKAIAEREKICRTLKEMGFLYITLDLEGFRSGSMDIVEKLNALVGK